MTIESEHILTLASETGFTLCGIARCRALSEHEVFFRRWIEAGYNSSLGYMERHSDKRFNPATLVDGAKSVIVCALNYKNNASNYAYDINTPKIASYAAVTDYHNTLREMLRGMLDRLQERYPALAGRCFVDTAPLLEKAWAVEAGLGWIGANSLLVNPHYGSYLVLGEIVIDHTVDSYAAPLASGCAACRRCIDACPAGAICEPMVVDTRKCVSMQTQYNDECPPQQLHGWIFGCDECLRCCPYNANSPKATHPQMLTAIPPETLSREYWLSLSDQDFRRDFGHTPLSRCKLEVIKKKVSPLDIYESAVIVNETL